MSETVQIPAGSPVNINLGSPAPAVIAEPSQLREGREAKRDEKAKAEGVNDVLKALGVKKDARSRMLEEIKGGRVKLAEIKAELVQTKAKVEEKVAEVDAFKPYKDQVESLSNTLKEYADAEFAALPEEFQKFLVDMKTEDPKARLDAIKSLKKSGALTAGQAKTATEAVKDETKGEKKTQSSNTLGQSPNDVKTPTGPAQNHYEQWKQLTDSNQHFLAAQYMQVHQNKILEQMPKPSRA